MTILQALEADSGAPVRRFRVRVIKAGASGNRNFYPDEVLREAVPLFQGARVIVKDDATHLAGKGKDPRAIVGRITEPVFVPGTGQDMGAIEAVMEVIDPADPMVVKIREAVLAGMGDVFGLSIDARAIGRRDGNLIRAQKFTRVNSVDLIVEPGAGGRVLDVIEAAPEENTVDRAKVISLLQKKHAHVLAGRDVAAMSDQDLEVALTEALADGPGAAGAGDAAPVHLTEAQVQQRIDGAVQRAEARQAMRVRVQRSSLPETGQARVITLLEAAGTFDDAATDKAIADEAAYLAPLSAGGRVHGLGALARITTGETRQDKVRSMLEAFFDPKHKDHGAARSIRAIYTEITGDADVTGRLDRCDEMWMREALGSTTLSYAFADVINKAMVAQYRGATEYGGWRPVASVVSVGDFKTQHRVRWGGYGDLPVVAESAAYQPLASPTDEEATYKVAKRGGLESITIEAVKNDDVGLIQSIPVRMGRSAARTLAKFVFDFLRNPPVIYDTKALFHVDHGNLLSLALSAEGSWAAARLAMLKQTEKDSGDRIGISPRYLVVPSDLEQAAYDLFRRDVNNDATFEQSLKPTILPVWYWTDANDWCAVANPLDCPGIEIGFLDGRQEPEVWVQDQPTVGSMFSNDTMTYKVRHIYGGTVVDFRGLLKSVVA